MDNNGHLPGSAKVAISSGILIFACGAVFWAGATYNQIGDIQKQIMTMDSRLGVIDSVPVLQRDMTDHERRLEKLEEQIRLLK